MPRIKTYLNSKERGLVPETIWFSNEVGTNESAKVELKYMFNGKAVFETPKPWRLVERILNIATAKDSIILDSFAGSGSTAQAVLNFNQQDGGNRKFILIEMEDYADNITAERVKRVIKGYSDSKSIEGSFDYYELGQPMFIDGGVLNETVGVERIRQYVYYSETKTALTESKHKDNKHFLGKHNDTIYYFNYEPEEITTLDHLFLATMKNKAEQYVVYANNCLLTKEFMTRHHIIFKKIPRDITRF